MRPALRRLDEQGVAECITFLEQIAVLQGLAVRQQDVEAIDAAERRGEQGALAQRELLARSNAPAIKVRQLIQATLDAEGDIVGK